MTHAKPESEKRRTNGIAGNDCQILRGRILTPSRALITQTVARSRGQLFLADAFPLTEAVDLEAPVLFIVACDLVDFADVLAFALLAFGATTRVDDGLAAVVLGVVDFAAVDFTVADFALVGFAAVEPRLDVFDVRVLAAAGFFLSAAALLAAAAFRARDEALAVRRPRNGRFQSSATSARKLTGIASTPPGSSIMASAAASDKSLRTSAITLLGRLAFAACTRLVSRMTNICRSGSIQMLVPVNPV